jgi:hypothetical protein
VRLRTALLCAMGLGIVVGGVGAAYVMGTVSARVSSYSERPPERYIVPGQLSAVELLPNVMAVHQACRRGGLPALQGRFYYGCAWPNRMILPDPCQARDRTAATVCGLIRAGVPAERAITVEVCRGRGFWAELACHEWAHATGLWPGDHPR